MFLTIFAVVPVPGQAW